MRTSTFGLILIAVSVGCQVSGDLEHDLADDDVEDLEAKEDAARPRGLYKLVAGSVDEGETGVEIDYLDLRRDGTFYINEDYGDGFESYFGRFSFTARGTHKYIRLRPDARDSWRLRYTTQGDLMTYYLPSGAIGGELKRQPAPAATRIERIHEVFESGSHRRRARSSSSSPDAVWSRYHSLDHEDEPGAYGVYTVNVDGTVYYALIGSDLVEIYAANNQLVAAATRDGDSGWEWSPTI